MIYQVSSMILQPGKRAAFIEIEKDLCSLEEKYGMKVIGSWFNLYGDVNEITHIVACEDIAHLEKYSMAMTQDKEWSVVSQKIASLSSSHSRKLMMPMPGSPMK